MTQEGAGKQADAATKPENNLSWLLGFIAEVQSCQHLPASKFVGMIRIGEEVDGVRILIRIYEAVYTGNAPESTGSLVHISRIASRL